MQQTRTMNETDLCNTSIKRLLRLVCLLLLFVLTTNALTLTTTTHNNGKKSPKIKRVAIIGAGIAGLSLAHALENSSTCAKSFTDEFRKSSSSEYEGSIVSGSKFGVEVQVFDGRPSLNLGAGAGVQLTGGMSTLKKINPELQRATVRASVPLRNIKSRAKPWFEGGEPFSTLLEINLADAIRSAGADTEAELIVDGEVMAFAIMRGALQEVLLNNLPNQDMVNFGKKLSGIKCASREQGIICQFNDGSEEGPFDLVVGSDGIESSVKQYIERGEIPASRQKRSSIYSGIRIQYAVKDGNVGDDILDSADLCQYFGDGLYALAGMYGTGEGRPRTNGAYLIFKDPDYIGPFKRKDSGKMSAVKENADWSQDNESVGSTMMSRVQESCVPSVEIGPIINASDRFFELGVYFHNPFTLNGWSKEVKGSGGRFVVLSGDAAHAMPPFLGQGSNQAIQDSYTLAKKIFQHNANCLSAEVGETKEDKEDLSLNLKGLLKEYERIRWLPTASITAKAALLGYLETGEKGFLSKFRDSFFFVAGKIGLAKKVFLDSATPKVD